LQTFPPLRVLALAGLLIPDAKKPIRLDESLAEPAYHCHRPLFSDVADVRQHLLAEQFERFHQLIGMFRARGLERQIDDADADLFAALLQLRDDLVRPAAEVDRQHSVNIGRPPSLAGDVALVEFQQGGGDPVLQREYRLPRVLGQRLLRLLAGLSDQDVCAIDYLVRLRLPAVERALVLVVAGHLAHCVVIAVLAPDQRDPAGLLKMDCDDRVGRSDLGPSAVPWCVRERSLYLLETIRQGRLATSREETAGEFAPTLVSIYGEFAAAA
jgi:hypothetical protein